MQRWHKCSNLLFYELRRSYTGGLQTENCSSSFFKQVVWRKKIMQGSKIQPKLRQTPAYVHTPCSCTAKCLFPKHFTQNARKPKALSPAGRARKSDKHCPVNHMYCRRLETCTVFPELSLQCSDFLNSVKTATLKGVLFLLLLQNPTNSQSCTSSTSNLLFTGK